MLRQNGKAEKEGTPFHSAPGTSNTETGYATVYDQG